MMENMLFEDGDRIVITLTTLHKLKKVTFTPEHYRFASIPDPKEAYVFFSFFLPISLSHGRVCGPRNACAIRIAPWCSLCCAMS
jgi:hypothetical protein